MNCEIATCDKPIHKFNVTSANGKAATALDSRVKNLSSNPYGRNYYFNLLIFVINLKFKLQKFTRKLQNPKITRKLYFN